MSAVVIKHFNATMASSAMQLSHMSCRFCESLGDSCPKQGPKPSRRLASVGWMSLLPPHKTLRFRADYVQVDKHAGERDE